MGDINQTDALPEDKPLIMAWFDSTWLGTKKAEILAWFDGTFTVKVASATIDDEAVNKGQMDKAVFAFYDRLGSESGAHYRLVARLGDNDFTDAGMFRIDAILGGWATMSNAHIFLTLMSRGGLQSYAQNLNNGILNRETDIVVYNDGGKYYVYLKYSASYSAFDVINMTSSISQGELFKSEPWSTTTPAGTQEYSLRDYI